MKINALDVEYVATDNVRVHPRPNGRVAVSVEWDFTIVGTFDDIEDLGERLVMAAAEGRRTAAEPAAA